MTPPVGPPRPALTIGAQVDLPMLVVDLERRDSRRGEFTMLTLAPVRTDLDLPVLARGPVPDRGRDAGTGGAGPR